MREIVKVREDFELDKLRDYGFYTINKGGSYIRLYKSCNFLCVPISEVFDRKIYTFENTLFGAKNYQLLEDATLVKDLIKDGVIVKEVVE